jgi:hypothetical protein
MALAPTPAAPVLLYYIQNDSGESPSAPNACRLSPAAPGRVTLEDVLAAFPLTGSSSFHFRFQTVMDKQSVFLDLVNPQDSVPVLNGGTTVIAKVLRLDNVRVASKVLPGHTLKAYVPSQREQAAAAPPPRPAAARPAQAGAGPSSMPFAMPTMKTGMTVHVVPKEEDGETHIKDTGEGTDIYANLKKEDARGMRPVKAVVDSGPVEVPDEVDDDLAGKSDYVKAKIMARRNELRKAQEVALSAVTTAADKDAQESLDMEAAKAKYEARLKEWALEAGGKVKNIRVLLTTLHTVMWEGSRWEPVPLAKVVQAARVKVSFLKAITNVHPDKQNHMDASQRYIATQVFHYLETAYRDFQEKEMGGA